MSISSPSTPLVLAMRMPPRGRRRMSPVRLLIGVLGVLFGCAAILCSPTSGAGVHATFTSAGLVSPSRALLDISSQGLLGGPSPASGFDFHDRACLVVDSDRLRIASSSEAQRIFDGDPAAPGGGGITFRPGMAFLTTDLCAMGHSAKDAPLLMDLAITHNPDLAAAAASLVDGRSEGAMGLPSDVWDAAAYQRQRGQVEGQNTRTGGSSQSSRVVPLQYVVYGNLCMTPDPSFQGGNKRTPTWHQVVFPWFRAVVKFLDEAIGRSAAGSPQNARDNGGDAAGPSRAHEKKPIEQLFAAHYARNRVEAERLNGGPLCFERIATRHERYRWMAEPGGLAVAAFRSALYSHFGTNIHRSIKSVKGESAANAASHGGADGEEIRLGEADLSVQRELRRPLVVTVLVRDEDRHFNEAAVVEYLQRLVVPHLQRRLVAQCPAITGRTSPNEGIGGEMVNGSSHDDFVLPRALLPSACRTWDPNDLTVRPAKFDNIKGSKGAPPPTPAEQLQILYDTDILLAAHGAGLAAVLLMRPGTAVVEFIPHNFAYYMYEEAALVASVHYRPYTSRAVHPARCCKPAPAAYGGSAVARWFGNDGTSTTYMDAPTSTVGAPFSRQSESSANLTGSGPSGSARCRLTGDDGGTSGDAMQSSQRSAHHRALLARRSASTFTEAFHINGVGARPCKFCDIALDAPDLLEVFAEMFRLVTWSRSLA